MVAEEPLRAVPVTGSQIMKMFPVGHSIPIVLIPVNCCEIIAVEAQTSALRDRPSLKVCNRRRKKLVLETSYVGISSSCFCNSISCPTASLIAPSVSATSCSSFPFPFDSFGFVSVSFFKLDSHSISSWTCAYTKSRAARNSETGDGRIRVKVSSAFGNLIICSQVFWYELALE